jgi:hypothetical protein
MAIACQAASRLLPERETIDLEADRRRKKHCKPVSMLQLLPIFVSGKFAVGTGVQ